MKPKIPPRHLPVLIATSAIPALRLLSGLLMWLLGDSVLSSAYVMSYFVLPALTLAVLPPIICQSEDRSDRVIFTTIVLAGFFIMTMIFRYEGRFPTYAAYSGQEGLSRYESYVGTYVDPLPELEDLGQPADVEFHYFANRSAALLGSDCSTLICTYSPDDYATMTAELEDRYTFHTEPLDAGETDLPPLYTLDGYEFRFLEMHMDTYHLMYPKTMILIGTNDETHEIVWSCYDDDDLDYIPDPVDFLLEDCGWKYIR